MITAGDAWGIVKARLMLPDDSLKSLIDTYIAEIERRIKHYCNIRTLPDDLLYVWASMVIDAVRVDLPNVSEIEDSVSGGANIKIGDTSISGGGTGSGLSNTAKAAIDGVVFNYRIDLNRYRKMRW